MSVNLVVLCISACAMISVSISVVTGRLLPGWDWLAERLPPRARARFWLVLASLPILSGALAVGVSFLPALGWGHDHCLAHGPHHPHLCPHHVGAAPGIVLVGLAVLSSVRLLHELSTVWRGIRLNRSTSGALSQGSEKCDGTFVFSADRPQAFVLGVLRPRIHVSSSMVALGPDVLEPVLAHERVHAARRDLLWRVIYPLLAVGHLPGVSERLRERLSAAQEIAADAEAAETLTDGRLRLAEALLRLARVSEAPAHAMSFLRGDLEARVRALLSGNVVSSTWPVRSLLMGAFLAMTAVGAMHDPIHHALETLLGALS